MLYLHNSSYQPDVTRFHHFLKTKNIVASVERVHNMISSVKFVLRVNHISLNLMRKSSSKPSNHLRGSVLISKVPCCPPYLSSIFLQFWLSTPGFLLQYLSPILVQPVIQNLSWVFSMFGHQNAIIQKGVHHSCLMF